MITIWDIWNKRQRIGDLKKKICEFELSAVTADWKYALSDIYHYECIARVINIISV